MKRKQDKTGMTIRIARKVARISRLAVAIQVFRHLARELRFPILLVACTTLLGTLGYWYMGDGR
ncbi:MAG: hypothetical protein O7H41_10080 [Planctomycetota bacterium]|nr:hypothetical protein [Planctomycetota bacterium]